MAIYEGDIAKVVALIRRAPHPLLLDTPNDNAYAPIHIAVSLRHAKIVRYLIVAGAKPSPRNIRGDSPLHIAARNGDLLCCQAITTPVQPYERNVLGLLYEQQHYQPANLDQWNYQGRFLKICKVIILFRKGYHIRSSFYIEFGFSNDVNEASGVPQGSSD